MIAIIVITIIASTSIRSIVISIISSMVVIMNAIFMITIVSISIVCSKVHGFVHPDQRHRPRLGDRHAGHNTTMCVYIYIYIYICIYTHRRGQTNYDQHTKN